MSIIRREQLVTPLSASYAATASIATSASYAATASYAENAGVSINTGSFVTTSSFNAYTASINSFTSSINAFTASYNTGSFTGSFTGSLLGTSSWAVSASQAASSSYTLTASYVNPLQQDVIITGSIYIPDSTYGIYFSGSSAASKLTWNNTDGTLDLGLKGGDVTLQIGQESVIRVVNKTGANLLESEYKAVRIRRVDEGGAQGQRLAIVLAQANNDANSVDTLGLVTENINNNQEGFITTSGLVRNVDTTGTLQGETWADGDALYLSPTTAGAITKVKPQAPQHTVTVGYVVYAHVNNGKIFVKVDNGYEIDELHNVRITTSSLSSGDLLVYSSSIWINSKQLTGSYQITGSLFVSNSIDSNRRILLSDNGVDSLNWEGRVLLDNDGFGSADWRTRQLLDSSENVSVDWESRKLYDPLGDTVLDWANISIATFYGLAQSASSVLVDRESVNGRAYLTYVDSSNPSGDYERLYSSDSLYLTGSTLIIPRVESSFTGSLLGTASYATQALSASFATTASYINPTFISASAAASGFGSGGGGVTVSTSSIVLTLDGLGGTVTTGSKGYIRVPFNFTINSWSIIAVPAGSITFDVWKANNTVPTVANTICGGNFPSASSPNTFTTSSNITSWTSGGLAGDIIGWNLASASNASFVTFQLNTTRTL